MLHALLSCQPRRLRSVFNLQGSEIIIVLLLALVVLGPEKLPDAMRKMGQAYAELKKMSAGFQSEFRAAVDEPLREIRDTANVLRDSADFTKLQAGERDEKPKSAEMAPADPNDVPVAETPTFESPSDDTADAGPQLAAESKPAPFSGQSSAAPATVPTEDSAPPAPFTGVSSTAPADAPVGSLEEPVSAIELDAASDPIADADAERASVDDVTADTADSADEADTTR